MPISTLTDKRGRCNKFISGKDKLTYGEVIGRLYSITKQRVLSTTLRLEIFLVHSEKIAAPTTDNQNGYHPK